ncbi:MAG TPA: DUF742 domain-containing protein [Microthrixaceae bacterium]|nr:DUF742 domain-containing protein [Microthrixaceae bacterium]
MSSWDDPTTGTTPVRGAAPESPDLDVVDLESFEDEDDELVRPFVITGGRTRHASIHLRVESLVVATGAAPGRQLQFEHARIIEHCNSPISVAEVAARIGVPLGVAQILVGDLAEAGLVQIHEARQAATPALLLRMIDAVRAL